MSFRFIRTTVCASAVVVSHLALAAESPPRSSAFVLPALSATHGPLRVHPANGRYFSDRDGRAVYLTGSHTWSNLQDMGPTDPPPRLDFEKYLDFLTSHHHNYTRLWTWEFSTWRYDKGERQFTTPLPWRRTGPGTALDGKPRFDLTQFDSEYFQRLRERVAAAGQRGIYVSVMLFEGNGLHASLPPWCWDGHPFNPGNNINEIDGDPGKTGRGLDTHTLKHPAVTRLQEAYIRHVVDTLNDLDNVLYEVANESGTYSRDWQYHVITFLKSYQRGKPRQHPVGMTFLHSKHDGSGPNRDLFASPADWISPGREGGYRENPPAATGQKVILADTDHFFGIGGTTAWVWKSVCRGLNPIYMDSYRQRIRPDDPPYPKSSFSDHLNDRTDLDPRWEGIRRSLGYTLAYAQRMNLEEAAPDAALAASGYCLATKRQLLVYLPDGGNTSVDLTRFTGRFSIEWLAPEVGRIHRAAPVEGGARRTFTAPFTGHAVLFLSLD